MATKPLPSLIKRHLQMCINVRRSCSMLPSGVDNTDHADSRNDSIRIDTVHHLRPHHLLCSNDEPERRAGGASECNYSKQPIRRVHNAHVSIPAPSETLCFNESAERSENTVKSIDEIPGPKSIPFFGGLFNHLRGGKYYNFDIFDIGTALHREYGMVVREKWPMGFQVIHVFDPDDVETVYRSDGKYPVREAFRLIEIYNRKYADNVQGLLTSHNENWHRLRKSVQKKILRPKAVAAYLPDQAIVADDLVKCIHDSRDTMGEVTDLRADLYKYAAECIGVVCFNKRLGAFRTTSEDDEATQYINAVNIVVDASDKEFGCFPFYLWFETPLFKRLSGGQQTIRRLAEKYSDLAVQEKLDTSGDIDGEAGDLIPYLLTKTNLSRADVIAIISELITAGVDTTSHFLAFVLYGLARSEASQSRLITEIDNVIPDGTTTVTSSHLNKMPYLRAVLLETLRYHPVVTGSCRTLSKDVVCSNYKIPKGTFVAVRAIWNTRDEKYFDNPNTFAPERWLRNTGESTQRHPFVNNQFGHGTRSCVGKRFANQEVSLAIVKILQRYRIEYHGEPLKIKCKLTFTPDSPLSFRFVERR